MSQNATSFHVRLPESLKEQLQRATEGNGNSLNQEIVTRLQRTFQPDPALRLADDARPFLDGLSEKDQAAAIGMIVGLLGLASKPRKRR
ncbi:Arc family DNA-binding protein [Aminobacter sp. NyZ550]|uniref:Arc family DNA-binding protein n=1 Tax=Aminobacter sp. NyZ550 TaxID=2979870 RepID=UPI0021D5D4C0|nr:Arc family DNA-binding protein [Aminobacter sp. NyZ550]WAX93165.1 Arc family DNA-binding protein [Aminobacter sp. NyZ550]